MDGHDDFKTRMARASDFQEAMTAGWGIRNLLAGDNTYWPLFYANLQSGAFAESGVDVAAHALWENIQRLDQQTKLPYSLFNYGRRFQEAFLQICAEQNHPLNEPSGAILSASHPTTITADMKSAYRVEATIWNWIGGNVEIPTSISSVGNFLHAAGIAGLEWERVRYQIEGFIGASVIQAWTVLRFSARISG